MELAPGVHQLSGFPKYAINWYVVGDVLIDAGGRPDTKRILGQLREHNVTAHALTHAHPDHQGASHAVCTELGIPFWVGERDVPAAERPELMSPDGSPRLAKLSYAAFHGPGHKVDRVLREGDEVAGFTVLDTPGHSAGHVSFWRESDRVLIAGDVVNTMHPLLMIRADLFPCSEPKLRDFNSIPLSRQKQHPRAIVCRKHHQAGGNGGGCRGMAEGPGA